jgi:small subunit ribosomal protein S6
MSEEKKANRSHLYEGMYIVKATLSEDARQKALDRIVTGITSRGGEVVKLHDQGRKRLAYEIEGNREGYYFLLYFKSDPSAIAEMWQDYHINEDLLRWTTLRTEKVLEKLQFKALVEQ